MKNVTSINQNYIFSRTPEGNEERVKTTKEFCKEFMKFCDEEIKFYTRAIIEIQGEREKQREEIEK